MKKTINLFMLLVISSATLQAWPMEKAPQEQLRSDVSLRQTAQTRENEGVRDLFSEEEENEVSENQQKTDSPRAIQNGGLSNDRFDDFINSSIQFCKAFSDRLDEEELARMPYLSKFLSEGALENAAECKLLRQEMAREVIKEDQDLKDAIDENGTAQARRDPEKFLRLLLAATKAPKMSFSRDTRAFEGQTIRLLDPIVGGAPRAIQETFRESKLINIIQPMLLFSITRFTDDGLRIKNQRGITGLNQNLTIPTTDGREVTYEPTAIICHRGDSLAAGHYFCLRKENGKWLLFDDDQEVGAPVSAELFEEASKNCYLIAYKNASVIPNARLFQEQWGLHGLHGISAPEAWKIRTSAEEVSVAIVDQGMTYDNPSTSPNLGSIPLYARSSYPWINGRDSTDRKLSKTDTHGDHCGGIVGADPNIGGTAGVAWKVKLFPEKIFCPNVHDNYIFSCIQHAVDHGAKVLNCSFGSTENPWGEPEKPRKKRKKAFKYAYDKGVIVVVAAGNETKDNDVLNNDEIRRLPACFARSDLNPDGFDNIVVVAATNEEGKLASFSYYGQKTVHLAAPGDHILSTWNGERCPDRYWCESCRKWSDWCQNLRWHWRTRITCENPDHPCRHPRKKDGTNDLNYAYSSGTSMAAPHVAGAFALMVAEFPTLSYRTLIDLVLQTVDKTPELGQKTISGGSLNLARALGAPIKGVVTFPELFQSARKAARAHHYSLTYADFPAGEDEAAQARVDKFKEIAGLFQEAARHYTESAENYLKSAMSSAETLDEASHAYDGRISYEKGEEKIKEANDIATRSLSHLLNLCRIEIKRMPLSNEGYPRVDLQTCWFSARACLKEAVEQLKEAERSVTSSVAEKWNELVKRNLLASEHLMRAATAGTAGNADKMKEAYAAAAKHLGDMEEIRISLEAEKNHSSKLAIQAKKEKIRKYNEELNRRLQEGLKQAGTTDEIIALEKIAREADDNGDVYTRMEKAGKEGYKYAPTPGSQYFLETSLGKESSFQIGARIQTKIIRLTPASFYDVLRTIKSRECLEKAKKTATHFSNIMKMWKEHPGDYTMTEAYKAAGIAAEAFEAAVTQIEEAKAALASVDTRELDKNPFFKLTSDFFVDDLGQVVRKLYPFLPKWVKALHASVSLIVRGFRSISDCYFQPAHDKEKVKHTIAITIASLRDSEDAGKIIANTRIAINDHSRIQRNSLWNSSYNPLKSLWGNDDFQVLEGFDTLCQGILSALANIPEKESAPENPMRGLPFRDFLLFGALTNGNADCFINSALQLCKAFEDHQLTVDEGQMPYLFKFLNEGGLRNDAECRQLRQEMARKVIKEHEDLRGVIDENGTAQSQQDAAAFLRLLLMETGAPQLLFREALEQRQSRAARLLGRRYKRYDKTEEQILNLSLGSLETKETPISIQGLVDAELISTREQRWNEEDRENSTVDRTLKLKKPIPATLVACIKRYGGNGAVKNQRVITGLDQNLTIPIAVGGNAIYEPTAIICHRGDSLAAGHYFCLRKENGKWLLFNDDKEVGIPVSAELFKEASKNCYVISYRKIHSW